MQAIDAQVQAGQPLTAEQQRYITEFANIAGTDALIAIPRLADIGVQAGADRAEAAVAGTLSALTNPTLGGTADVAQLPAVLRTLTEDPLSAVDDPGRRRGPPAATRRPARYEGVNQLLGATSVPLGEQFSVTAGQQALKTSQLTAQVLDRAHFPQPLGFNTDAYRPQLEAAARGSSLQLTNVSRNLDAAQTLLLDADTRRSLLVTPHVDATGAVTLLERATERVVPVEGTGSAAEQAAAANAKQNAQVAAAVLTDVAQDPFGWREADRQGHAGQRRHHRDRVDDIDAFGRDSDAAVDVFAPARIAEGQYGGFSLGDRTRRTCSRCRAGRSADVPDADLVRRPRGRPAVHPAPGRAGHVRRGGFRHRVRHGRRRGRRGQHRRLRTAMHVHDESTPPRKSVFENGSLAARAWSSTRRSSRHRTAARGSSATGCRCWSTTRLTCSPEDTAGQKGTDLVNAIYGRQSLEAVI